MDPILLIAISVSFFCTYLVLPFWIKKAKQIGLVWEDMHKTGHPKNVAGSGGLIVVLSFILGVLIYVAITTFYLKSSGNLIEIFALICSILLVSIVGLIDDLFGWQRGGLSKKSRLILVLFSAIPLMVINAGESTMFGIGFGILFPLFVIPIGVIGATTTFNFLAGYNGLEASQGIILLSAFAITTYLTGNAWLSVIALCMVVSLFAIIAILGNMEKIAVFFFIPYICEVILKSRGKLEIQSFAKLNNDGSLEQPHKKIYGLEHLAVLILKKIKPSKKVYEKDVVLLINGFQIIIILLGFWLFL